MRVRDAEIADLTRITEIYNQAIVETVATFDLETFEPEQRREWFAQFGPSRPILVCETAGGRESDEAGDEATAGGADGGEATGGDAGNGAGAIGGYAYYLPHRPKPAYAHTKELTVYVDSAYRGRGIASALYSELIERARSQEVHVLIGILGGENEPSAALHRKFGFELAGRMPEVGRKFDRWVDTYTYVKIL